MLNSDLHFLRLKTIILGKMEDSEKSDCAENVKSAPKKNEENVAVNSKKSGLNEEVSSNPEKLESPVSKCDSSNESLNSDSEELENGDSLLQTVILTLTPNENALPEKASPEVESIPQHTFKKPGLIFGPRKGKHTIVKPVSPTNPCHSIIPAEWFQEKSEKTENVHQSAESSEEAENEKINKPEDAEIILDSQKENEKMVEKEEQTQEENDKQIQIEKENQLKIERQKQMKIEKEKQIPLPYKEPPWSGKPEKEYKAEVLKSGLILETIDLSKRNFYVVGRLPVCDIALAHPTISRYHAVFQYRCESDEKNDKGLYLYDLGSTHGTFWNGNRVRPNMYVRIRGGHLIKFGNSQRKFIINTPPDEEEEESELTVTELKEKRRLELEERTKMELERRKEKELAEKLRLEKEETEGINWGMGEDADEESDLTENPYAATNNEELFLEDPKKTLRGWFEREGHEMQYQAEEKGIGRFMCWVDLPVEDYVGRSIRAEATVKGKKKEAVVQCALEACRILDRHGLLRQAIHEGRKRKARNWEEEDFYDSDEDNFLDRTGTVEKKREQRMRVAGKLNTKAETYTSLIAKHAEIAKQIEEIESRLKQSQRALDSDASGSSVDALDAFMLQLKSTTILNKSEITKFKMDLQKLRKEEEQLLKLIDISKPANLPALKPYVSNSESVGTKVKYVNKSLKPEKTDEQPETNLKEESKTEKETKDSSLKSESLTSEESCKKSEDVDADKFSEPKTKLMKKSEKNEISTKVSEQSSGSDACEPMEEDEEGNKNDDSKEKSEDDEEASKRKKRNLKRIQQRALKAEKEKIKSYEEEKYKDDYCTWVPPEGQSGDGKTSLNDKFGY